jgi:hypothetical protein
MTGVNPASPVEIQEAAAARALARATAAEERNVAIAELPAWQLLTRRWRSLTDRPLLFDEPLMLASSELGHRVHRAVLRVQPWP